MTINVSGKWWVGTESKDIREFLESYAEKGYEVNQFRLAKCKCGSDIFILEVDDNEGVARRTCMKCNIQHYICDSDKYWDRAEPDTCKCVECGIESFNIGVGFSIYPDDPTGIKWLYIGVRCAKCGILGCFSGWKVAQSDALGLLDKV